MSTLDLDPLLDQFAAADGIEALKRVFFDDVRQLGYAAFDAWSLRLDTRDRPHADGNFVVASYGLGLIRDYIEAGAMTFCPALKETGTALSPFDYVALLKEMPRDPSAKWQLRLLRLFGCNHAWLVPMSTVDRLKGVTVYMAGHGPKCTERFHVTRHRVHLASVYFFEALAAAQPALPAGPDTPAVPAEALTGREAQCLSLAAAGRTNRQIADAIGVSENTVRFHFKNAFRKLGTTRRAEAVTLFAAMRR